jgi:hypothetical protein
VFSEVAWALSQERPDHVVAVAHYNGWARVGGRDYPLDEVVEKLRPGRYPELVIAFGDTQAIEEYISLARRGARVLWICNEDPTGGLRWNARVMHYMSQRAGRPMYGVIWGAGCMDALIAAMELAGKKVPR